MAKFAGLGRGLDELFGAPPEEQSTGPVAMLAISAIEPNREQPRRYFDEAQLSTLADSIARHGVVTPLTVRKLGEDRYKLIAGERRYRAARIAGLTEVPVIILEADELAAAEIALVENLQRADLNPIEEAAGFRSLIASYGLTQEDVAERVGKSRSAVTNAMRLLDLPDAVAKLVIDGSLSAGHARALLALKSAKLIETAAQTVIDGELSVRQTEALVKRIQKEQEIELKPVSAEPDYVGELSRELSVELGRSVKIAPRSKSKGKVVIDYQSLDDLDEILKILRRK
ncbi:MAG: ParB/RepB/Spo0J family partition protein [Ruminococcaceae bacterium]|nr:ParB/RepB/Spo0J family partition protein [Oscillospiraceae bacterium]